MYAYFTDPAVFSGFFNSGSGAGTLPLYVVWVFMAAEMSLCILPAGLNTTGSEKHRKSYYAPAGESPDVVALKEYIAAGNKKAAYVAGLWFCVFAAVAALRISGILGIAEIALVCMLFYVCDLICVVFLCPFRKIIMKNRCCITCRIYNWDWFMLCSPLILIKSFFSLSLVALSVVVLLKWEIAIKKHPEYFWEGTNTNLSCVNCAEKICGSKPAPPGNHRKGQNKK